MNEYIVRVTLGVSQVVEMNANSREEAISKAKKMYYNGEILPDILKLSCCDGLSAIDIESEIFVRGDEK